MRTRRIPHSSEPSATVPTPRPGNRRSLPTGLLLAVALPLALGGCGSSSASTPAGTASQSPTAPSTGTSSVSASATTGCDQHPAWNTAPNSLQPIALARPGVPVPAHRLVPSTAPASMLLCHYRFDTSLQRATLLGSRTITNADVAARHFAGEDPASASARSCPMIAGTDTGYVGILTYPAARGSAGGTVQLLVSGHNECEGTSNGVTVSAVNDAVAADRAFASGSWPA